MAKKEIEKKINDLRTQYKTVKKSLREAGYDIEDPAQLSTLFKKLPVGEILQGLSGSVSDFVENFKNELKVLEEQLKPAIKAKKKLKNSPEQIKDFQRILGRLNKQILQELPEHEKEYEQLSLAFEEERKTFQQTFGSYSQYSKHVIEEMDRIRDAAKDPNVTTKELTNYTEQINVFREFLTDNFKETEERANIIMQLTKQEESVKKNLQKKSQFFARAGKFISKHKVSATAIIGAMTTHNPLVMWGIEALGNMAGVKNEATNKQKQFRLQEMLQARSIVKGEVGEGRKLDFGFPESKGHRSLDQDGSILEELKTHTRLLQSITNTDTAQFKFNKENEAQKHRQVEAAQSAATEAALESKPTAWQLQSKDNIKDITKDKNGSDMFAPIKDLLKTTVQTFLILSIIPIKKAVAGMFVAVRKTLLAGIRLLISPIGLAIMAAATTIVMTFKNVVDAFAKKELWGVSKLSAGLSQTFLPLLGALAGSIFGLPVILLGLAIGSIAQYLVPEHWKKEVAMCTQDVQDYLEEFWYKAKIIYSTVEDSLSDIIGFMDKIIMQFKSAMLDLKDYANATVSSIPYIGGAIYDPRLVQLERQNVIKAFKDREKTRLDSRSRRVKDRSNNRAAIAAVGEASAQRQEQSDALQAPIDRAERVLTTEDKLNRGIMPSGNELAEWKNSSQSGSREPDTDLNIKGGANGQAFAGGETNQGTLALAKMVNSTGSSKQFTGFNDAYHKGTSSKHASGLAMDYTLKDSSTSKQEKMKLERMMSDAGVKGYVQDEYANPSSRSTGGHIHAQFASQADADKFAAYHAQQSGQDSRSMMASNVETSSTGQQRTPDTGGASTTGSQQYLAANADNSSMKMASAAPSNAPIIVNTPAQQSNGPTPMGSNESSRAAPRGNEPALQMALNADFSGSTS